MAEFWELLKEPGGAIWAITAIVIVWVLCIIFDCFANDELPTTDAQILEAKVCGLKMALHVISDCRDNICPGGLSENRQYEESIVQPHLDSVADELENLIVELREGRV
ncbi:hypothetical protein [Serratia fonticola]|uniref:hypothetical protein n=1 Tax=Serratia fonticola TaxID=47917 RepID=UPI00093C9250|nr:hypothetical protein [Serratia fonticola]MDQ7207688.1 hypothetical protein [Serratia fonticola]OKP16215.1 hypothetical protein BSQ40_29155 [Serratia fonticola]HBE9150650.1 hypothetical protein [Serratia fonticola]